MILSTITYFPTITASALSNEETIYEFLKNECGLKTAAACGVLANIEKESNFNPDLQEAGYSWSGGAGYGICQWTNSPRTNSSGRRTDLVNWCGSNGYNYRSLDGQLHFLKHELETSYTGVYNHLKSVSNNGDGAYSAGYKWCYSFEVPNGYDSGVSETRGNLARSKYWPKYSNQTRIDTVVDNSYIKNLSCTAPSKLNTYDAYGNRESNRWVDAGDSCTAIEAYTNGYWKIDYPASGSRRIAYMKLSEWNPFANTILPGTVDTKYQTNVSCTAPIKLNTYDANGNRESNRWVDAGDSCVAIEAYTNGYWKIDYPAGSTRRIAYMKLSEWNPFTNAWIVDTRYNTNVSCTAPAQIHTYDSNGNQESNRWVDPGDSCIAIEAYTNGFWKIDYPAGSVRRIAYMKLSEWNPFEVHTHSYTSKVTKEATCTVSGVRTYSCSCGANYTETIPAKGHDYSVKTVAPTTTSMGYDLHTCTVCNYSFKDNYTDILHTHSYTSEVTKDATCTVSGVRTYSCSCGDNYTETIPAAGHKYTVKTIAPTTTAMGYDLHTCTVCNYSFKDNYTDIIHTHSYTSEVTKEATCTVSGVRTYSCSCGDNYTETIPATGHKYTVKTIAPTTTAMGYDLHTCSVCKYSYKDNYTDSIPSPKVPELTATATEEKVTLKWKPIPNAEKYGIAGYTNGKWNLLDECYTISYELKNLKPGTKYKVAVVAMYDGKWNMDFSNAVTVALKESAIPKITYEKGNGSVKLTWTAVSTAEKYGIFEFEDDYWNRIAQTTDTSYVLTGLASGSEHKIAVVTYSDGKWNLDFSNAIVVSPNSTQTSTYPEVTSVEHNEEFHQFRLKWSAVPNAEQYGIAVKLSGKWKIMKTFDAIVALLENKVNLKNMKSRRNSII